jgi:hypothetical protein
MIAKPHFIYPPGKGIHPVCQPTDELYIEIHPVRGILLKGVEGTEAVMASGYRKLQWVVASDELFLQRSGCGTISLMSTGILREDDRAYHDCDPIGMVSVDRRRPQPHGQSQFHHVTV